MLARILSVGLLAGLVAGFLVAVLQQVTTTPLIVAAEVFETKAADQPTAAAPKVHDHGRHDHGGHEHNGHDEGWKPADGLPRLFYTSLATIEGLTGSAAVPTQARAR